jgi:hypothetical protein
LEEELLGMLKGGVGPTTRSIYAKHLPKFVKHYSLTIGILAPLEKIKEIKLMQNEKPIHNVRLGVIKAAIWKNEKESATWYNVKFERGYKEGTEWKSSESFGRDDLLLLAKVADQAHTWICERAREDNAERTKPATGNRP